MRMLRTVTLCTTIALLLAALPALAAQINEIRIDQTSTDNDEYFELSGGVGESLNDLTYLVIGDGTGACGVIEAVASLAGQAIAADGLFLVAEGTLTLGTADLTANLNFENSDNVTHLLVSGFTGATNQDLDTDNDGVLDVTPWTAIVDCVAMVGTAAPDCVTGDTIYCGTSVGPDGTFVPGHIYRCTSGWVIGPFDPAVGVDTPGTANDCTVGVERVDWGQVKTLFK